MSEMIFCSDFVGLGGLLFTGPGMRGPNSGTPPNGLRKIEFEVELFSSSLGVLAVDPALENGKEFGCLASDNFSEAIRLAILSPVSAEG
jgi:hypothetical protein